MQQVRDIMHIHAGFLCGLGLCGVVMSRYLFEGDEENEGNEGDEEKGQVRETREMITNWPLDRVVHSVFAVYNPPTNKQKLS
jgi:hypothetical protein